MSYTARRFSLSMSQHELSDRQKAAFAKEFPNASAFNTPADWTPDSWKSLPIKQQPIYPDQKIVDNVLSQITALPPLVHPHEIDTLGEQLAKAARGECFVIQGGDCVETFKECTATSIEGKVKILLQMALVVGWGARMPTVKIGRIAGQYAKPRSSPYEKLANGDEVMSFKGEIINGFSPTVKDRTHNPKRLLAGHFHSAATLNYIRAVLAGEFADLHQAGNWDLSHYDEKKQARYQAISKKIMDAMDFFESLGIQSSGAVKGTDIFTSHEGLILDYEAAVTKQVQNKFYNLGTHLLWIGNRTRQINGAHIEYFRGISNPVGVKVGPDFPPNDLVELILILNPDRVQGKVTLITRYGANNVEQWLPSHIKAIQAAGLGETVLWLCDCVHGNTFKSDNGYKTRHFDEVLRELSVTFQTHAANGSRLGGCHMEMTGDDVTECVGGPQNLDPSHLPQRYVTYCDPRLNYLQAMELSFLITDMLRGKKGPNSGLPAKM